jgi:hypothetical protein
MTLETEEAVQVHGIAFRQDGIVEITYAEQREQSPDCQIMRVMMLDSKRCGRQIISLLSDIRDVIDYSIIRMRDDPDTLPGMER